MIPGVYKGAPLKIPADDWRIVQQMVAEYRTRGAIGSGGGFRFAPPKAPPHPWQIQKAGGTGVDMVDGVVFACVAPFGIPEKQVVVLETAITAEADATTEIWVKFTISSEALGPYFFWKIDEALVESGGEIPASTADLTDPIDGGGDVFILIAEVDTDDEGVTEIRQILKEPYPFLSPFLLDLKTFSC